MRTFKAHTARPHGGSNLLYHGGPVSTAAAVYIVFWGDWSSATSAQSYVNGFFNNVGGSRWGNTTKQYCQTLSGTPSCPINAPGQLAGTWNDTSFVPSSPTQSDIQAEANRAAQHFVGSPNANDDFMVFTPSNHSESGFGTSWCAYHSSSGSLSYSYMPYQPDAGVNCGANSVNPGPSGNFDGFSIVGGHEYAETITDPQPNTGWLDRSGAEIGDKCAWISLTNISLGGNHYAVQPLWSNAAGGCVTSS